MKQQVNFAKYQIFLQDLIRELDYYAKNGSDILHAKDRSVIFQIVMLERFGIEVETVPGEPFWIGYAEESELVPFLLKYA